MVWSAVGVVVVVDDEFVELADAIRVVREQLVLARETGDGQEPRFVVGRVEMEFAVEIRRDAGGEGGVQLGVLTLKAGGGGSSATTHRVRLELTPQTGSGDPYEVRDRVAEPPSR